MACAATRLPYPSRWRSSPDSNLTPDSDHAREKAESSPMQSMLENSRVSPSRIENSSSRVLPIRAFAVESPSMRSLFA